MIVDCKYMVTPTLIYLLYISIPFFYLFIGAQTHQEAFENSSYSSIQEQMALPINMVLPFYQVLPSSMEVAGGLLSNWS